MSNTYWVELPLTAQGRRQPMDNLVRQLHEAGFMARRIRDFCTGASEKELYLENPSDDSYVNRVLVCRVSGNGSRMALRAYAERHADLFRPVREHGNRASERDGSYLQYLLREIRDSNARSIHSSGSVADRTEENRPCHTDWKDIDRTLRPYQLKAKEDVLRAWNGSRHVMLQMPTGTGKTRLFVSLIADIRRHNPDAKVLIVTHRKELVEQISRSLSEHYHLPHGILNGSGSRNVQADILVGSIQTLARRTGNCKSATAKWSEVKVLGEKADRMRKLCRKRLAIAEETCRDFVGELVRVIEALRGACPLSRIEEAGEKLLQARTPSAQENLLVLIHDELRSLTESRVQITGYSRTDYIIVDEAHHALAPSYQKLWEVYPEARILGVTATPCRLRKASFTGLFDTLVESQPMQAFIREGYLADYRYYTVSNKRAMIRQVNRLTRFNAEGDYLAGDLDACCNREEEISFLVDCYENFAAGRKGIVYAVNRSHGERIAERFREQGVTALSIDCGTPADERARTLENFRTGNLQILVNVELFTEGFDCPGIRFVMLARPTRSLALYLQQVGRALRPSPGGEEVVILDTAGLHGRFGLPDRKREWATLFKGERSKREDYNRPLGYEGAEAVGKLLVDVSRSRITESANVETTPYGWSVYHIMDKLNLMDRYGNAILKKHLLKDLKRDADGNYSAWLGIREYGCREGHFIRFTPDLALIPDNTFEVNGCRFHAFPLQGTAGRREYTLSLELESQRYSKVYSWNTEWAVMVSEDGIYYYTCPNLYPQVNECKVSLINDEPYLFTRDFIVGKNSGSHFYRRLPHGLYLYYRREGEEDVLYNAQLEPLWRGGKIEVLNEGMVLHDTDGKSRKVEYLDVLFGNVAV